jgi:hypothetical protein
MKHFITLENQKFVNYLLYTAIVGLFISLNFQTVNHQFIYISCEMIALFGIARINRKWLKSDVFIRYYSFIIVWCIIVTLNSPVIKTSFKGLTHWLLPILLYVGLYSVDDLRERIIKILWVPTLIAFVQSVVLFQYFHYGLESVQNNMLSNFFYFVNDEWPGKVFTSTINLCFIIFALSFIKHKTYRHTIVVINFLSGILTYDRAFFFSSVLVLLLYFFLEKYKPTRKLMITCFLSVIGLIFFMAVSLHLLGIDLHYKERFAVYDYWLPKLLISPIFGTGVELKSLQYILLNYPIPQKLLEIDKGMLYHSHNMFIDIALTQGFVGLFLFILLIYKMNQNVICLNGRYRFTALYVCMAIFTKFMVDDRFDSHNMIVFWFFILSAYVIGQRELK